MLPQFAPYAPPDGHFMLNPLPALLATMSSRDCGKEEALMATSDTEMKARIQGITSWMETFTVHLASVGYNSDTLTCLARLSKTLNSLAQRPQNYNADHKNSTACIFRFGL